MTPFFPSFVWYVLSSLHSWSYYPFRSYLLLPFRDIDISRTSTFAYNISDTKILDDFYTVTVSVCNKTEISPEVSFQYLFFDSYDTKVQSISTSECSYQWKAPFESQFKVTVRKFDAHIATHEYSKAFAVRNVWIVAVGDSFSSGEGNPEHTMEEIRSQHLPTSSLWLSTRCRRSTKSFAHKIFKKHKSTIPKDVVAHFTFLPCTGALVQGGTVSVMSQLKKVKLLKERLNRPPDLMTVTAGGNDIGYSQMLRRLLAGESNIHHNLNLKLMYLSSELDILYSAIYDIQPCQVIVPSYYDFSSSEKKRTDVNCEDLSRVSFKTLKQSQKNNPEKS
ncbi:unnamed protein product [Bursaphelenchus okinawaensis]|uniref:Lipase_GDSL domain-containing protein n=1 Tax=Bursaphelenchus okinawaensis TaxID=465554 RepID=A0A811LC00_9BILA|nr:unnamed protein product [Bursaphelenchus okinawaensis]CAG9120102.1 unnamed protein product [Bursaphelenchus okinawaensis]